MADTTAPSEDQQAIAEYLASETYKHRQQIRDEREARVWVRNDLIPIYKRSSAAASYWTGLMGLNGLVLAFGVLMPTAMHLAEPMFRTRPGYIPMLIFIQSFMIPPIIAFSFATVTPMFWYGSVIVRFLTGILLVTPGCLAFYLAMSIIEGHPSDDFWVGFAVVMFAQFLTAGTIALTVQMWSPWTLTHARPPDTPLPPLGTRAMMELTVVAAVGFSIFVSIDNLGEFVEGLLFFTAVGLVSSMAVIEVLIAFLRNGHRSLRAAVVSGLFAFAMAFLFSGFFAVMEFGWDSISYNFLIVAGVSLYGAAIICGVMWICLWWLRRCGWRCVSREDERREREQGADRTADDTPLLG